MSLVEQERLGMHLRKIVAVPSGDLQYEQEVSKWDSTRNAKQLHLRTDRANCSFLKCEELCKERVASNSIPQETFPWLAFLNPRFPLCRRPGSLCSACWLGEQCRHMCTWARQKLGSHPLLLSLPHSPYQMHHQVLLIAPPKYFSKAGRFSSIPAATTLVSATVMSQLAQRSCPLTGLLPRFLLSIHSSHHCHRHLFNTQICQRHPCFKSLLWLPIAFGIKTEIMNIIHCSQHCLGPCPPLTAAQAVPSA